jgi:hypothetical protein
MPFDPRDELWVAAFETYYDAFYQEKLSDELIDWWQRLDEFTKILVTATASGSAITGWALWNTPHFKTLWSVLAGIAALFSIIHASLGVPERLKYHGEIKRRSAGLRIELETFRYRMKINPNFIIDEFTKEFVEYRKRFSSDIIQLLKNDLLETRWLQVKIQDNLNFQLADQIIKP